MKVALLNTTIITGGAGYYRLQEISQDQARVIVSRARVVTSYIGHSATAEAFSAILDFPVEENRAQFTQTNETTAICLKMRGRLPEGKVITDIKELEDIGFDLFLLDMALDTELFSPTARSGELGVNIDQAFYTHF